MVKSIIQLYKNDFKEPTTENNVWADLLKNFNLSEDTEYVYLFLATEDVKKEITEQIKRVIEQSNYTI